MQNGFSLHNLHLRGVSKVEEKRKVSVVYTLAFVNIMASLMEKKVCTKLEEKEGQATFNGNSS